VSCIITTNCNINWGFSWSLVSQSPLQQIRILKTEPWTIPVDSHPIGRPPLSYPALREFCFPDVVASGHPPRRSRRLGIPATLSPRANRKTKCLWKQHQHCKETPNPWLRSPFQSSGVTLQPIQYYYVILGLTPIIPRALRCHPTHFPCSDPGYRCRDVKTL